MKYLGHNFEIYLPHLLHNYYICLNCGLRLFDTKHRKVFYTSEISNAEIKELSCNEFYVKNIIE